MEIKRSITIGQFIPTNSFIHRLDPRTKLLSTILFMIIIFFIKSVLGYTFLFIFVLLMVLLSKVSFKFFINGIKPILFLIIFTVILQIFFTKGKIIFSFWYIVVTLEGLYAALFIFLRLILLVFSSSLLTLSTSPMELTFALEYLLTPFKYIGLPSSEISIMMTIALRFIPTILEETDRIIKAQSTRGADFESGNIFKRIQSMIPILVPLFVSAFRRADDLAIAMEARCFQVGAKRGHLKEMFFRKTDIFYLIIFFSFVVTISIFY